MSETKTIVRKTLCGCLSEPMVVPANQYQISFTVSQVNSGGYMSKNIIPSVGKPQYKKRVFGYNGNKQDDIEIFEEVYE